MRIERIIRDLRHRLTGWETVQGIVFVVAGIYWWLHPEDAWGRLGPIIFLFCGLGWLLMNKSKRMAKEKRRAQEYDSQVRSVIWPAVLLLFFSSFGGAKYSENIPGPSERAEISVSTEIETGRNACRPCQPTRFVMRFIQRWEGYSPVLYRDAAGLWTIGHGILVTPAEFERYRRRALTPAEADSLFMSRLRQKAAAVNQRLDVPLLQWRFDSILSFTYNAGEGALGRSTLLRLVNSGEFERVPGQFRLWVYAGGHKLRGLERRREAEAWMFQLPDLIYSNTDAGDRVIETLFEL